ncbi:MAG: LuxR C-terminal-related transcriptional regulator [Candidatus Methylomirabilales bacterium]
METRSLRFLTESLSNAADGVLATDQAQRLVLWNEAAERLLGFQASEVLGKPCYEVLAGRERSGRFQCGLNCALLSAARERKPIENCDILTQTKSAQAIWINVSSIVIPSSLPSRFTMVHIFRDVTRQVQRDSLVKRIHSLLAEGGWSLGEPMPSPRFDRPTKPLTSRQRDVLRWIAKGESAKGIATRLHISPTTARNHTQRILAKLGVHSKLEALAVALRYNLL